MPTLTHLPSEHPKHHPKPQTSSKSPNMRTCNSTQKHPTRTSPPLNNIQTLMTLHDTDWIKRIIMAYSISCITEKYNAIYTSNYEGFGHCSICLPHYHDLRCALEKTQSPRKTKPKRLTVRPWIVAIPAGEGHHLPCPSCFRGELLSFRVLRQTTLFCYTFRPSYTLDEKSTPMEFACICWGDKVAGTI